MAREQGEPAGSMKWHILRHPERPGTFVALGAVLTSAYEVEESLTSNDNIVPIPEEDIKDVSHAAKMAVSMTLRTEKNTHLKAIMPTQLPVNLGGSISGGREKDIERKVDAYNVRASVFKPSDAYMETVLQIPRVASHLRRSWLGSDSLFIIVGVATAQNLTTDNKTTRGYNAGVGANAAVPLAAVETEAEVNYAHGEATTIGTTIDHEVVFAYRVREFTISRYRKKLKDQGYVTAGALFGNEKGVNSDGNVPTEAEYDFEFDGFADEV
ncbi:hypothetical protein QIS74_08446 [Colletotrichum tabaci]|uniref:Uncharacterized protein n=1 Tax=Colletotrichum tabaci TaxID=1209068 RepID=A0AAV9T823_9PEZI